MFEEISLLVIIIITISSLIRSIFGFGDALIAMPLLAMLLPIKTVTPLVALIAVIIAISILIKDWKSSIIKGYFRLLISIAIGIILGVLYLKYTDENLIKLMLAIILLLFSVVKLFVNYNVTLKNETYAPIFGFISGMLGSAYNVNGPPIIIYGTLRNWEPTEFRAKLQGIFLPTNLIIVFSHFSAELITKDVIMLFIYSSPAVIVSIILGSIINKRLKTENFSKFVYILLLLISLLLFTNVIGNYLSA